ncbi:hypothetical protein DB43_FB00140 [Parachlamydia acanthamoebae]|uniref:Protein kinase domain-containing protein n=1 Tax=Parachlamydia acanthamoebae TaxID=83552 RepID=A0A0C1C3E5_9BACT|nr:hypothetical protein DB43_FB00140 [Parachlamydia acanthamoebae]
MLKALKHLYAKGYYVHRDIKEHNILWKKDEKDRYILKLSDFEMTCKKDWKFKYGYKGTPQYISHEISKI